MSDTLKPCPFCGGKPSEPKFWIMDDYWHMSCVTDWHPIIEFRDSSEVAVVNAWNRRSSPRLEALERVVVAIKTIGGNRCCPFRGNSPSPENVPCGECVDCAIAALDKLEAK